MPIKIENKKFERKISVANKRSMIDLTNPSYNYLFQNTPNLRCEYCLAANYIIDHLLYQWPYFKNIQTDFPAGDMKYDIKYLLPKINYILNYKSVNRRNNQ